MLRYLAVSLTLFLFSLTAASAAEDNLAALEAAATASRAAQPGLDNYLADIATPRIEQMMTRLTRGVPDEVKTPTAPSLTKLWQRSGPGLVYANDGGLNPYVAKVAAEVSAKLAIELDQLLLPSGKEEERRALAARATCKISEVALAESQLQRLELTFEQPVDLDEAFYLAGARLPQKRISKLVFDIERNRNSLNELAITTADGLQLSVEVRYLEVAGGYLLQRLQVTSPDGSVADLFEVSFTEQGDFTVPKSIHRVVRRPNLDDDLEVFFLNYRINQPLPEQVRARLVTP
jgi:hypothetical protein